MHFKPRTPGAIPKFSGKQPPHLLWIIGLAVGLFLLDIQLPLGIAAGVPYVIPILLSIWLLTPRHTVFLALLCAALTIGGLVLSPPGTEPLWMVLINRGYGLLATGLMALAHHLLEQVKHLTMLQERQHIAWELHDGIAQMVGSITARAAATRELLSRGDAPAAREQVQTLIGVSHRVSEDLREAIQHLHHEPVRTAFLRQPRQCITRIAEEVGISVKPDLEAVPVPLPLSSQGGLQMVSILREALQNIRKHAGVNHAIVTVKTEADMLELTIKDTGRGIPESTPQEGTTHFGIPMMKQRAKSVGGVCEIQSTPGKGTTVTVRVPTHKEQ